MTESESRLRLAEAGDGPAWWSVIHEAFSARRPVDPPASALSDTPHDVEQAIRDGYGIGVEVDGQLVGCLILAVDGSVATLRRVSVLPSHSRSGVAAHLVRGALGIAMMAGFVYGLARMPMTTAYSIVFVSPLLITALAVPLLGEKVGPRRWGAIGVGMLGVLVVRSQRMREVELTHGY